MQAVLGRQKGSWSQVVEAGGDSATLLAECGVLRTKFWQESPARLIRSSLMKRSRSFSERIGPRIILLESQPNSKRFREITTEPIAV